MSNIQTTEYKEFIERIKIKAQQAQIKASVKVNSTLLEFYWELGQEIVEKQKSANWGSAFLKNMSKDLMREFPNMKGFSHRNLKYIRQWYLFYFTENENGQQVVAHLIQIPWGHNLHIITKSKSRNEALYYVQQTIQYGWSRNVLVHQVEHSYA
jgi:predicted nuclease of restriction endonuclease-like (RecB) superfamily